MKAVVPSRVNQVDVHVGEIVEIESPTAGLLSKGAPFQPFIETPPGVKVLETLPLTWEGGWGARYRVRVNTLPGGVAVVVVGLRDAEKNAARRAEVKLVSGTTKKAPSVPTVKGGALRDRSTKSVTARSKKAAKVGDGRAHRRAS